jgi:hypothetical protein
MATMRLWPVMLCVIACATPGMPVPTDQTDRTFVTVRDGDVNTRIEVDRDPSRHRVAASQMKSWNALAGVYEAVGIPLTYADPRLYKVGNARFVSTHTLGKQPMSKFLRCGNGITGPLADKHRIQMSIWTELKPIGVDSTAVFTQIDAKGSSVDGTGGSVTCVTTGVLELTIVQLLQERVTSD